jgi:hypothetical protein
MRVRHIDKESDFLVNDFESYWALFERPFKCTCCCLARPEMTAVVQNRTIGKVNETFTCFDPTFNVIDSKDQLKWKISANCCQCGLMCRNSFGRCSSVEFFIHSGNSQDISPETRSGFIKKVFTGVQELVTDANNFQIEFPESATPEEKLLLISTTLMIDYRLFEDSPGEATQH